MYIYLHGNVIIINRYEVLITPPSGDVKIVFRYTSWDAGEG